LEAVVQLKDFEGTLRSAGERLQGGGESSLERNLREQETRGAPIREVREKGFEHSVREVPIDQGGVPERKRRSPDSSVASRERETGRQDRKQAAQHALLRGPLPHAEHCDVPPLREVLEGGQKETGLGENAGLERAWHEVTPRIRHRPHVAGAADFHAKRAFDPRQPRGETFYATRKGSVSQAVRRSCIHDGPAQRCPVSGQAAHQGGSERSWIKNRSAEREPTRSTGEYA
jgi:hypothetical protein